VHVARADNLMGKATVNEKRGTGLSQSERPKILSERDLLVFLQPKL